MHEEDSVCGIAGKDVGYEHPPRSSFAAKCRRVPAEDIQHITAILKDDVIRRVRAIPLDPGADYRSKSLAIDVPLNPSNCTFPGLAKHISLRDYNFDPRSANARKGYGGGVLISFALGPRCILKQWLARVLRSVRSRKILQYNCHQRASDCSSELGAQSLGMHWHTTHASNVSNDEATV